MAENFDQSMYPGTASVNIAMSSTNFAASATSEPTNYYDPLDSLLVDIESFLKRTGGLQSGEFDKHHALEAISLEKRLTSIRCQDRKGTVLITDKRHFAEILFGQRLGRRLGKGLIRNIYGTRRGHMLIPLFTCPGLLLGNLALSGVLPRFCTLLILPALLLQVVWAVTLYWIPLRRLWRTFRFWFMMGHMLIATVCQLIMYRFDVRCLFPLFVFCLLLNFLHWDAMPPRIQNVIIADHKMAFIFGLLLMVCLSFFQFQGLIEDVHNAEINILKMRTSLLTLVGGSLINVTFFLMHLTYTFFNAASGETFILKAQTLALYSVKRGAMTEVNFRNSAGSFGE